MNRVQGYGVVGASTFGVRAFAALLLAVACTRTPAPQSRLDRAMAAPADSCISPIDRRTWSAFTETRISRTESHFAPASPAAIPADFAPRALAGRYDFTMIATARHLANARARGELELAPTPFEHVLLEERLPQIPLIGSADIDLSAFGRPTLAHATTSRDVRRPGVQVWVDEDRRSLELSLGNSIEFRAEGIAGKTLHAGLTLYAFRVDSQRIVGWWHDAGYVVPSAEGYFCAVRRVD